MEMRKNVLVNSEEDEKLAEMIVSYYSLLSELQYRAHPAFHEQYRRSFIFTIFN